MILSSHDIWIQTNSTQKINNNYPRKTQISKSIFVCRTQIHNRRRGEERKRRFERDENLVRSNCEYGLFWQSYEFDSTNSMHQLKCSKSSEKSENFEMEYRYLQRGTFRLCVGFCMGTIRKKSDAKLKRESIIIIWYAKSKPCGGFYSCVFEECNRDEDENGAVNMEEWVEAKSKFV